MTEPSVTRSIGVTSGLAYLTSIACSWSLATSGNEMYETEYLFGAIVALIIGLGLQGVYIWDTSIRRK